MTRAFDLIIRYQPVSPWLPAMSDPPTTTLILTPLYPPGAAAAAGIVFNDVTDDYQLIVARHLLA